MTKASIRDYSNTAASNTDVQGQNIDEGCSPATINNAIREVMADIADINDGTISLVSPDFDAATINSVSIDAFPSGTKLLFQQTSAPTGWVKVTTHNDKALRVVSGTAGTGGSVAFETAFASQTPTGSVSVTVAGHAITENEMPSHNHTVEHANHANSGASALRAFGRGIALSGSYETEFKGGGAEHGHTGSTGSFSGNAINLDVQYVDIIIATKS